MGKYAKEMEWEVSEDSDAIQTAKSCLWNSNYKKNGELKTNAKPSKVRVLTTAWALIAKSPMQVNENVKETLDQIVLEHNLWINRHNPERMKEIISEEVRKATADIVSTVRGSIENIQYERVN